MESPFINQLIPWFNIFHFENIIRGNVCNTDPQVQSVPWANQDNYLPDFRSSNNNISFLVNFKIILCFFMSNIRSFKSFWVWHFINKRAFKIFVQWNQRPQKASLTRLSIQKVKMKANFKMPRLQPQRWTWSTSTSWQCSSEDGYYLAKVI